MPAADDILRRFLEYAIELYGPRYLHGYLIAPVTIGEERFAETIVDHPSQTIMVRITIATEKDPIKASYQLAHESIHCLIASGRRDTIWFEEGLANHFALRKAGLPRDYWRRSLSMLEDVFRRPLRAFEALNASTEDIREFRAKFPRTDEIEAPHVEKHFGVTTDLAERLCRRMPLAR